MSQLAVSVVGLGKLGACMAACFADAGHTVVGVDVNAELVDAMNRGEPPHFEPQLAETLRRARARFRAKLDYAEAIIETDVTFIVVPTPSEASGAFSLKYVKAAASYIGRALRAKSTYHVVVVTSTVLPGSCEYGILPVLERESGKKLGGFGLCYNPEFIALGTVIHDFMHPDFVLIGESDKRAGGVLVDLYSRVTEPQPGFVLPSFARMSIPSAELAKIGINWALVNKINMANMMGDLCEKVPGTDVAAVTQAMGMDSRIGPKLLRAGMPASGPCLPRDTKALAYFGEAVGVEWGSAETLRAVRDANDGRLDILMKQVLKAAPDGATVAVLGLAFKPGTTVTDASPGLRLALDLADLGRVVHAYDPLVTPTTYQTPGRVRYAGFLEAAIEAADVIVVANPDPAFEDLGDVSGKIVIDPWRIVKNCNGDYRPGGIGATDQQAVQRLTKMWAD